MALHWAGMPRAPLTGGYTHTEQRELVPEFAGAAAGLITQGVLSLRCNSASYPQDSDYAVASGNLDHVFRDPATWIWDPQQPSRIDSHSVGAFEALVTNATSAARSRAVLLAAAINGSPNVWCPAGHDGRHGTRPADREPESVGADAIVLFDRLSSTDLNTAPITHPAQKQALADVLSRFEWAADTDRSRGCLERRRCVAKLIQR